MMTRFGSFSGKGELHIFAALLLLPLLACSGALEVEEDHPPEPPGQPSVVAGNEQLSVSWQAVEGADSYSVWYGVEDNPEEASLSAEDITAASHIITGLDNEVTYYVWVRAYNEVGASDFSEPATGAPFEPVNAPEPPGQPTVVAGDAQLSVSWQAVEGADTYSVWYGVEDNPEEASLSVEDITAASHIITGLDNEVTYYVWVRACNSAGPSDFSESAIGMPFEPAAVPESPGQPTVVAGDAQLSVSWQAVEGADTYSVWYGVADDTAEASLSAEGITAASHIITGLDNEVTYYVWVRACNSAGPSDFSQPATGVPLEPATAPESPGQPTVVAGSAELSVSWQAVEGADTYSVWYGVEADTAEASLSAEGITATSHIITGLDNEVTYYVWVRAHNEVGASDFSEPATGAPFEPVNAPEPPGQPTVVAGDAQLSVTWSPVENATAYEVWYAVAGDADPTTQSGGDIIGTSHEITGLVNSQGYRVWLRAKNADGISAFSDFATGTPVGPPPAPAASMVVAGDAQLSVSWSAVFGADSYSVWYHQSNDPNVASLSAEGLSGTTHVVTGLQNGLTYYVWITAVSAHGESAFSGFATGTPLGPPPPPGAPTVVAGDRQLTVSWNPVPTATAYEVWYAIAGSAGPTSQSGGDITATSQVITDLINGQDYLVWLRAKNAHGLSEFSPPSVVAPVGPPPEPEAPTVVEGDRRLTLSWTAVHGATAYEVWYGISADSNQATQATGNATTLSYAISGLDNGRTYFVWLRAKNSGGISGFGPPGEGTPIGAPARPDAPSLEPGNGHLSVTWEQVPSAASYEVWYGTGESPGDASQSGGDILGTEYVLTGLANGARYRVWLQAKNVAGTSPFSAPTASVPMAGAGTPGDPFIVTTIWALDTIRHNLSSHFRLESDIDAAPMPGWLAIGSTTAPFTGSLDGNGKTISNLSWSGSYSVPFGLFAVIDSSASPVAVLDLTISNMQVSATGAGNPANGLLAGRVRGEAVIRGVHVEGVLHSTGGHVGGLVGEIDAATVGSVLIEDCHASVAVTGRRLVGGLVGFSRGGLIQGSSATGSVEADTYTAGGLIGDLRGGSVERSFATGRVEAVSDAGGLVGVLSGNLDASLIERSFATGDVYVSTSRAGGLVGASHGEADIVDCYALGDVSGPADVGGLVGSSMYAWEGTIVRCYSTGAVPLEASNPGGLVGDPGSSVVASYYNRETSGYADSGNGEPRTTAEMTYPHDAATYDGWDFSTVWEEDTDGDINGGYPFLR